MQALNGANEPGSKAVLRPVRRPHQNDPGCLDEEHAQIAVAALGEAPEDSPVSGRHLFGHEAEAGGKGTALGKGGSIGDRSYHRACDDRADARNGHQLAATLAAMCQNFYLFGDVFDTLIKTAPIATEVYHDPDHAR